MATNPIQFQFYAGRGIATYVVSFSGLNYDAAEDGDGNVKAIPTYGGWASYEHFFNPRWHANLVGGFAIFDSHRISSFTIPGSGSPEYMATDAEIRLEHYYVLVNAMWTPEPALTFGLEYNFGDKTATYEGSIDTGSSTLSAVEKWRSAHRISFGMFFDF